jgi:hypothetical protein
MIEKIKFESEMEAVVVELYRGLTIAEDCNGYFHAVFCNRSILKRRRDNYKNAIDLWLGDGFELCEEGGESYWCEEAKVWWTPDEFPPEARIRRRRAIKQQFGVGRYRLANGQEAKIVSDRGPSGCELLGIVVADRDYFDNWTRTGECNRIERNLVERIGDL